MEQKLTDTRETLEAEFKSFAFDYVVEDYYAGKITLEGLKQRYTELTGVECSPEAPQ